MEDIDQVRDDIWKVLGVIVRDGQIYATGDQMKEAADIIGPIALVMLLCIGEGEADAWIRHLTKVVREGRREGITEKMDMRGHA